MALAQVTTAHELPDRPSIRLSLGQHVEVGGRDDEWPEFVFVTTCDGSGWVPSRHLSMYPGAAVVRVEYDTTELATAGGEQVEVLEIDDESGWAWCRARSGGEGWVPIKALGVSD